MAISTAKESRNSEAINTPLLLDSHDAVILHGYVDYKGHPSNRSNSGGWRSAAFILGGGTLERFAFRGLECNLINYLTGPLGESTAVAAGNVNLWIGLGTLMPVFGAVVADSFLGLYQTNIITSIIYILGLGLSTLSVVFISSSTSKNQATTKNAEVPFILKAFFFVSLYLVALAQGFQSTIQAFGADQFDRQHPEESKANSSFFNWWAVGLSAGIIVSFLIVPYVQENIGWAVGFGIPCLAMVVALILLLMGYRTYRFAVARDDEDDSSTRSNTEESLGINPQKFSENRECLDKVFTGSSSKTFMEAKKALRLLPIWCTTVMYTIAWAQAPTLFTKQATTMERSITPAFSIPSASLRTIVPLTIVLFTPIYDRVFVPIAEMLTGNPRGITEFQRIKMGMIISIFNMVIAALVETKRLEIARDHGLIDIPNATVPMSVWWLVPQDLLCAFAYLFAHVGMQKFFYDQVPIELRSIGLSLSFIAFGAGNFLSSFLIYAIDKAIRLNGGSSWFCDNLNQAHLDYFYWVLAVLGFLGLTTFTLFTKSFSQSQQNVMEKDPEA